MIVGNQNQIATAGQSTVLNDATILQPVDHLAGGLVQLLQGIAGAFEGLVKALQSLIELVGGGDKSIGDDTQFPGGKMTSMAVGEEDAEMDIGAPISGQLPSMIVGEEESSIWDKIKLPDDNQFTSLAVGEEDDAAGNNSDFEKVRASLEEYARVTPASGGIGK